MRILKQVTPFAQLLPNTSAIAEDITSLTDPPYRCHIRLILIGSLFSFKGGADLGERAGSVPYAVPLSTS